MRVVARAFQDLLHVIFMPNIHDVARTFLIDLLLCQKFSSQLVHTTWTNLVMGESPMQDACFSFPVSLGLHPTIDAERLILDRKLTTLDM